MRRTVAFLMRLMGRRTCEDVASVLQDYFDGTLDAKLAAAIDRHFEDCPDCRHFARTYGDVIRATGEVACEDIPEEVRQRVREAIRERAALRGASTQGTNGGLLGSPGSDAE